MGLKILLAQFHLNQQAQMQDSLVGEKPLLTMDRTA